MEISIDGVAGVDGDKSNEFDASTLFNPGVGTSDGAGGNAVCTTTYSLKSTSGSVPSWVTIDSSTGKIVVDLNGPPNYS